MNAVAKWSVVAACVALTACSPFPKHEAQKPTNIYTLDEIGKITRAEHATCSSIVVDNVRAAPGYGSARMVYSRNPHQLEFFAYSTWADVPARMLQTLMVNALEKSGRFTTVLNPSTSSDAKLRLDAELVTLQQQFNGSNSRLQFQMRVHLLNNDQVIATKLFQEEEESGTNPESGVTAANHATAKFASDLNTWLDEVTAKGNTCRAQ